jgi:hypothetical protein
MARSWLPKVKVAGGSQSSNKATCIRHRSIDRLIACNVAPVFLDTKATVTKTIGLIREAASNKADLVVFPETHIPGYGLYMTIIDQI